MGLLDAFDSDQFRLGLGLLAAGGARSDGMGFGGRVQEAFGSMDQFKKQKAAEEYRKMQIEQERETIALQKQAREQDRANEAGIRNLLSPQGGSFDPRTFMANNPNVNSAGLQRAMEFNQSMQPKAPEFSTAPQYDQSGRAFILAKDGSMKYLDGVKARDKLNEVRLGNQVGFRTDYSPDMVGSLPIGQSPDSVASNQVSMRGQNMTDSRARERLSFDQAGGVGAVNGAKPVKQGPMSVTLQKELLESDDVVQSGAAIVDILKKGKEINSTAYSGYGAKGRAVIASNMPWNSQGADATIDLDNMMTGQALESLKSVFGGMPTEGERKILLDMQASSEKTPAQREAIMNRAIEAAQRRASFAGKKASAIRNGTYLTDGVAPDEAQKPAPKPANAFDSKPPAQQYKGKFVTAPDGKRYQSDGLIWKEVR